MKVTSNGPITAARQRAHGVPADPTVRLAIKFRKLNRSILNNDFYGAKTMVSEVYDQAAIIADFDPIWDNLEVDYDLPEHAVAVPSAMDRTKMITDWQDKLESEAPTQDIILQAMDALEKVFGSMYMQFRMGRLPQYWDADLDNDYGALQRYMCAAILREIDELLRHAWTPLRKKVQVKAFEKARAG